ncbi:PQQ-binding-like beta-propeller repeat protein [Nocardia sp. alder85J]|uniref:Rv3212 family protein n=1 Tax=Nocardia sp. alder85J TaxID=2862949 RepID=UPI001CD8059C|nr:PQQ-binding-like beta-propeller repeat protein [Nocardia sp. alder85J]MCX4092241.1 PQQ-binding-like beta-propeller repeat protein [Nocardia sp. alder85J]
MLVPERRTRADLVAAAVIAVVVVVLVVVVWAKSDARATVSEPAGRAAAPAAAAERLPQSLHELWHAPDGAADRALAVSGVAVTADDGTLTGHDPVTGHQLWKYQRDMPLCGAETQYGAVIATYRDRRGCSQTTLLAADTGARRTARSSFMDQQVIFSMDGTYTVAQGPDRLEVWRSDLVRTLEYGYVDAPVNPRTQPRKGCRLFSAASSSTRLAVLEHCPDDPADRLTVQNPAPKDSTVPEEYGSHVLTEPGAAVPGARLIAVSENRVVLYLPGTDTSAPEFAVYDASANLVTTHRLTAALSENTTVARVGSAFAVYTGNSVIALNATTFDPMWTAADALGTPALMAGQLLLPVTDGIAVLDPATGAQNSRIPLQRTDYHGELITLAATGSTVLERRGTELYCVGQP